MDRDQYHRLDESNRSDRYTSGVSTPLSATSRNSSDDHDRSLPWPQPASFSRQGLPESRVNNHSEPNMLATQYPPFRYGHPPSLVKSDLTLPPLRSVLRSPPTTPGIANMTLQPSPREWTHDHYAPYRLPDMVQPLPKRNCPEDYWDGRPTRLSPETYAPPRSPHDRRDSKAVTASADERLSWTSAGSASLPSLREHSSRSYSESGRATARSSGSDFATAPSPSNYQPTALFATEPRADPYRQGRHYDSSPTSVHGGERWRPNEADARRRSMESQRMAGPSFAQAGHLPYRGGPTAQPPYHAVTASPQDPGHSESHAYMPSAPMYEYPSAKSRKRSNLPKQSTEIMKRWFDEHIENPYPSEEQKKYFAAKANINLTQVSNWFINHRRRCPELKDKRDKGSTGNKDDYY